MIEKTIEELILYAKLNLDLKGYDVLYARNIIMSLLNVTEPYSKELNEEEVNAVKQLDVPDKFIDEISEYAKKNNLYKQGMEQNFAALIMALLSPSPQALTEKFADIKKQRGGEAACKYLLDISVKNNYIQKTAINKNIMWRADFEDNFLEITINLSKPEKDNKDILKQLTQPQSSYPKCMLCAENLGFEGNLQKPPRQNLRYVPISLNGENWFMQYSPYMYYDEHCIIISEKHNPMRVDKTTITKLLDFVSEFPFYFIGSNASLPIVGGSILSHEHYQGGGHKMPLHYSSDRSFFDIKEKDVSVSTVNWYNSVVRLKSKSKESIYRAACRVFDAWQSYNDESSDIISKTTLQHNAVTPIMRKENDLYVMEIILRNNRTSEKYPDGIFHAHPQYHNIKKEGIGLIEAMGLFILPARLKREISEIKEILCGKREYDQSLIIHKQMIDDIKEKRNGLYTEKEAEDAINNYINLTCKNILINTAIFKPDEKGIKAFDRFMQII